MKYLRITILDEDSAQVLQVLAQVPDTYRPVNAARCSSIQIEYLADIPPAMPRNAPGDGPEAYPWYPFNFTQEGNRIVHEGSRFYLPPNGLFYEVDQHQ